MSTTTTTTRFARVLASAEVVEDYLYANYTVLATFTDAVDGTSGVIIAGEDKAGFTLDAVRGRLASGLIGSREM